MALTVIGGGLGGLVAAIAAAEGGAEVRLYEAQAQLGGRWRASDPPFVFHEGPHVIYRDGPLYPWLRRRGLLGRTRPVPVSALRRFGFRLDGRLRHRPPLDLLRVLLARPAPVEVSFTAWATDRVGQRAADRAAAAGGVALFHPRPGDLSAAFVQERLRRVFALPPQAGYREGGWGGLMDDLGAYARRLGVQIQLPLRPGEERSVTITRLERLADVGLPGWRGRVVFRRDAVARGRTGAVDYPGTTWRDRPAVDRGEGVYLVGDQVAAPGLLSEVSVASGVRAGQLAASRDRTSRVVPTQ